MSAHRLEPLFNFSSIAVVGATDSSRVGAAPYQVLQELGYTGRYYPINPGRAEVHGGVPTYPNPASTPEPFEVGVIAVARERAVPAVVACAERGAKAVVLFGGGFAETDERGQALQAELIAVARQHDLLVIGPNCFGVASLANRCAAYGGRPLGGVRTGNVGVISHSGGLLIEILSYGGARGIGFSHLSSLGNEAVVGAAEVLDYFVADPATEVIVAVLETVRNPALFVAAAERAVAARKPLVVLRMGASAKGARAALSHTGALAGSDEVYNALFRQKGIIRVRDMDELIDMGALLGGAIPWIRRRRLERAAVIEISGGGKELICDSAADAGIELPELTAAAAAALRPELPPEVQPSNPLDTTGNWVSPWQDKLYPLTLRTFASEPEVDMVVSRLDPPRTGDLGGMAERVEQLLAVRAEHPDILFTTLSRTSDQYSEEWLRTMVENNIIFLEGYGRGMRALGRMATYSRYLAARAAPVASPSASAALPPLGSLPALPTGRAALNEVEAKDWLRAAGLPVVATDWARSADEAVACAERHGYPVAAKVLAPRILHKSDVGGVRLGLRDAAAVRQAYDDLAAVVAGIPGAEFQGVALQPMAKPGLELALGAHRDPQFGPVVLFGLGGITIEALGDVALRVAPLSALDAHEMLAEIRGHRLLDGGRGQPAVDRAALVGALGRLGEIMLAHPAIAAIDLNPIFGYADGILAVDARVILTP